MFQFELTLDEANTILAALGKAPFETVAALIGKIKQQAEAQLQTQLEAAEKMAEEAKA